MGIFSNLTGWHFLIILLVVLLIFGATRLPALAKSVGQSTKILRDELRDGAKDPAPTSQAAPAPAPTTAAPAAPAEPTTAATSTSTAATDSKS